MTEQASKLPEGLPAAELAELLRDWTVSANSYARRRKNQFRVFASIAHVMALALTAASTIILGLQDLNLWADVAFGLVAVATALGAVEPFFNWRSRWILAEEAQHRLYRLEEDLRFEVASSDSLSRDDVEKLYAVYAKTWDDFSQKWLQYRREGSRPSN